MNTVTISQLLDFAQDILHLSRTRAAWWLDNYTFDDDHKLPQEVCIECLTYPHTGFMELVEEKQLELKTEDDVNKLYWTMLRNMDVDYMTGYDNRFVGSLILGKYMAYHSLHEVMVTE